MMQAMLRAGQVAASNSLIASRLQPVTRLSQRFGSKQYSSSLGTPRKVVTPVNILIAANVAVFGAYLYGQDDKSVRRFYDRHMFLSNSRVKRSITPFIGHMFSHVDVFHLLSNMVALKTFGDVVLLTLGNRQFTTLYFASGIVGGMTQLLYHRIVPSLDIPASRYVRWDNIAVGASAAIAGITMYSCATFPRGQVFLFILPIPNLVFMGGFVAWSIYGAYSGMQHGWAHAAHLGGACTGLLYYGIRHMRLR